MTTWHQVKIHIVLVSFINVKSDVVIAYRFTLINWPRYSVSFYQLTMKKSRLYKKEKKNEMICISRMALFNKCHHRIFVYCLCHTVSREKSVSSIRNTLHSFCIMNIEKECDGILWLFLSVKKGPLVPWNIRGFVYLITILFWPRTIFLFKQSSHCLLGHKS